MMNDECLMVVASDHREREKSSSIKVRPGLPFIINHSSLNIICSTTNSETVPTR